ncbi:MAG: hypothetical protein M0T84_00360 [Betaproteobacteria bacterium]|nr:hypothetical protein [Betaproteobacteria bacterium]
MHEERETLCVDVNIPGHDPRTTTALFSHTKKILVEREKGRCFVCGRTAEESGHPLEAHHHPIERSLANMIDWSRVERDCRRGMWGEAARNFDWSKFDPADPYSFVDDMTVNGELLCKEHHTGKDEGKHDLPWPLWIAQRYGKEGYKFSLVEVIHHAQD